MRKKPKFNSRSKSYFPMQPNYGLLHFGQYSNPLLFPGSALSNGYKSIWEKIVIIFCTLQNFPFLVYFLFISCSSSYSIISSASLFEGHQVSLLLKMF